MPIRRRDIRAERSKQKGRLRHPLLKHGTVTLRLYNFIKENPGCRSRDFEHITSSRQPATNLMDEGLIRPVNDTKPLRYEAVPENETGKKRDKVLVKLAIFVNRFGEFSLKAELDGQKLTATEDFPQQVLYKEVVLPIPAPDDPYAVREIIDINDRPEGAELTVYTPGDEAHLTIEGDWTKITP